MVHMTHSELTHIQEHAHKQVCINALYAHYKNPEKRYRVLNIGIDKESLEPCVIYQSMSEDQCIWIRKLSSWQEMVDYNGSPVHRFQLITK